jgi:hypothetical protein
MKRLIGFANKDVALEPGLERVKARVHRVIENCLESVKDLDDRGWNEVQYNNTIYSRAGDYGLWRVLDVDMKAVITHI